MVKRRDRRVGPDAGAYDLEERALVRTRFVQFDSPGLATFQSREYSPSVGPGQALLRTRCSIISPGTELARLTGTTMPRRSEEAPRCPMGTGSAILGEVLQTGAAEHAQPGGLPVASRLHALYTTVRLSDTNGSAPLPEGVSELDVPLAVFIRTGLAAALCADVRFGWRVLVLGQGLIGYCAAQWPNLTPAVDVIASEMQKRRLDFARERGVDARFPEEAAALTRRHPFDIVVESTGVPSLVVEAFDFVWPGGAVGLLGTPRGKLEQFDVTNLARHHPGTVCSAHRGAHGMDVVGAPASDTTSSLAVCLDYLARGRVRVDGLIGAVLPAADAAEAFAAVAR
jgi:NADPH:quinone reductase-like Zn-dependent oxidoreductase